MNIGTKKFKILFFRLPGICHNFMNVSLWLPVFDARYLIAGFPLEKGRALCYTVTVLPGAKH